MVNQPENLNHIPSPDTREEVFGIFNRAYQNLAKDAKRWTTQAPLTPVERRLLLGYQATEAGIKKVTGKKPEPENALNTNPERDYFILYFQDPYSKDALYHFTIEGIPTEIVRTRLAYEIWLFRQTLKLAQNPETSQVLKDEIALLKHQRTVLRRNSYPLFETIKGNSATEKARIARDAHARSNEEPTTDANQDELEKKIKELTIDETQDENWINAKRALRRRLILRLPNRRAEVSKPIPNQEYPGCWLGTVIALASIPAEIYSSISEGAKDIVFGGYDATRDTSDILIESGKHSVKRGKRSLSAIGTQARYAGTDIRNNAKEIGKDLRDSLRRTKTRVNRHIENKLDSRKQEEPNTWGILTIPDNKVAPTKESSIEPSTENPEEEKGRKRLLKWGCLIPIIVMGACFSTEVLREIDYEKLRDNFAKIISGQSSQLAPRPVTDLTELGLESAVIATQLDPSIIAWLSGENRAKKLLALQEAISAKEKASGENIPANDPDYNAAVDLTEETLKYRMREIHVAYLEELRRVNADHPNLFNAVEPKSFARFGEIPVNDSLLGAGFEKPDINQVVRKVIAAKYQ